MTINEATTSSRKSANWLLRIWQYLIKPHSSIREVGEQRSAQLAITLILVITFLNLGGFFAGAQRTGYSEAFYSFGISLIGLPIAYIFAKTRQYRAGAFLFSLFFAVSGYFEIIRQKGSADIATEIFIYIPLSLIVASTFLSGWAVFLLVGLDIGILLALQLFGITLPDNLGGLAGIITTIGLVLILLGNFRNRTESIRLEDVRNVNRELEILSNDLEKKVQERTTEIEAANLQTVRRASQLQAIANLMESIAEVQDLGRLLPTVTDLISERFGFYHVGVFLVDADREYAVLQAANSEGGQRMLERNHRLKLGRGVVGYAAQTGQARIALNVGADAVYFENPDLPNTRSEAALPLISRGETIGVLDVQSTEQSAFSSEDLQTLSTLANQVSIALENARLLTESRNALARAEELYNEFTRTEWSRTISASEQAGFRFQNGRIEIVEKELQAPEVVSAVEKGSVVASQPEGPDEKRAVAVPVKLRGEVIGVLHVESNDPSKEWQEDEISLVAAVAERAAIAMENARLFQDARRRAAKEQLISEASARIGSALDLENVLKTTAEELERVLGGSEVLIQFQNKEQV